VNPARGPQPVQALAQSKAHFSRSIASEPALDLQR